MLVPATTQAGYSQQNPLDTETSSCKEGDKSNTNPVAMTDREFLSPGMMDDLIQESQREQVLRRDDTDDRDDSVTLEPDTQYTQTWMNTEQNEENVHTEEYRDSERNTTDPTYTENPGRTPSDLATQTRRRHCPPPKPPIAKGRKRTKACILTLQETYLSEEYAKEIAKVYGKTMKILFTANKCHAMGKAGVAVVLNKNLIQTEGVITMNLIPGMSGNFNLVEDALDRLPAHEDKRDTVNTFTTFRKNMALHDGWQNTNPDMKNFPFTQMAGNFLRSWIDRIYVSTHRLKDCEEWEIKDALLSTDHRAVNVKMTHPIDPYVGKGRWTMPLHLLKNGKAIKEVEDVVKAMATGIQDTAGKRTESENPQMIYAKGKEKIIKILQKYARCSIPIKKARMEQLQAELDAMLQDDTTDEDSQLLSAAILQQKIQQIRQEINDRRRMTNMVKARLEMETISKYWLKIGNPKKPRDTIQKLQRLNSIPPPPST
ncbi:hypothetical protein IW261DRAFT_1420950 [Armillaria novae-zelandiae]|uniref:Endonuclease/exonuclease/phosphatase domain-containing protein n=1 Tax=Armillaria novae-zelandiae TaxID=153914 RepID=A0AA39P4Y5_9AGAR|nr:hypothetical protein IW261DRAFT_1420950 [Armillaria novae-zelandiae]